MKSKNVKSKPVIAAGVIVYNFAGEEMAYLDVLPGVDLDTILDPDDPTKVALFLAPPKQPYPISRFQ